MNSPTLRRRLRHAAHALAAALAAAFAQAPGAASAQALPSGATVVHGTAGIQSDGTQMTITNSPNAIVNWQSFSIGEANSVQFQQQSAASKVLNRVTGSDPSSILGRLSSNGEVWLVNPNGVLFGKTARVDVGALVASTLGVTDGDFLAAHLAFGGDGAHGAQLLNQGSLSSSLGGHVWLIGGSVSNEGTVTSSGGQVVLAAGDSVELVDSALPNLSVRVNASGSGTVNLAQLLAPDGSSVDVHGAIVNQKGIVRADSLGTSAAGNIVIRAAGDVALDDGSITSADSAASSQGAGGRITVQSIGGQATVLGNVSAAGVASGGRIELLGRTVRVDSIPDGDGSVNARGTNGGGLIRLAADSAGTPAQSVSVSAKSIDAGSGDLDIAASTVNIGAAGRLFGGTIGITGDTLTLDAAYLNAGTSGGAGRIALTGNTVGITGSQLSVEGRASVTATGAMSLDGATLAAQGEGDAIVLSTARLSATGSSLVTERGRWLVYLDTPGAFAPALFDALGYTFVQVGADAALAPEPPARGNGVLVRAPLDVRVTVDATRVYDGTTGAAFSRALSTDLSPSFVLNTRDGTFQGRFADKQAGTGKRIALDGAAPYTIATSTGQPVFGASQVYLADITPRPVSVALSAADKVYDAGRSAGVSGTLSGAIAGDDVRFAGATGLFDSKDVGAAKTVTVSNLALGGADAADYRLADNGGSATASITPRPISTDGIVALDKVYDGTRTASLSGSLSGVLAGDFVTLNAAGALFDDRNAGTGKTVSIGGASLAGLDAANYSLASIAPLRAAIGQRPLDIVLAGEVRKEYDATAGASLSGASFRLDGLVAGDALSVRGPAQGSFASPDVGRNKPVSASGAFAIDGADAANYRVDGTALTAGANLIQASVSADIGTITPATLVYQASPVSITRGSAIGVLGGSVTGFKGGDTLASATAGNAVWQGAATPASPPGVYAVTGGGLAAANYVFVQAPGNATALDVQPQPRPDPAPGAQQQRALATSTQAIQAALQAALPVSSALAASGAVFDLTAAPARAFEPVRIGAMSQEELGRMLADRREFKRQLFAEAIYKLSIDPSLAEVRSCATAADAASGSCRITPEQVAALQAAARPAAHAANAPVASLPRIERKIALLIGINDYADQTIPQLENAIPDADAVGRVFADKLGYEVRVLRDPGKAEIIRALNSLAAEAGPGDSVVIYYAGHGLSMERNGPGYWIAADATVTDPKGWISNGDVARLLAGIRSRQVALISDSCYSGLFAREGLGAIGRNVVAQDVLAKRSVVVLSSGGDEPVPDAGKEGHSIFAWHLMRVIGSVQGWEPGSTVFADVRKAVRKEFPQTPRYGSLSAAGHQAGGEYLFESRQH